MSVGFCCSAAATTARFILLCAGGRARASAIVERAQHAFIRLTGLLVTLLLLSLAPPATAQSPLGDPRDVGVHLVADGLTAPVTMAEPPDDTKRLFVVD